MLWFMGSQRVRHDQVTELNLMPHERKLNTDKKNEKMKQE